MHAASAGRSRGRQEQAEAAQYFLRRAGGIEEEGGVERGRGGKTGGALHEEGQLSVAEGDETAMQESDALRGRESPDPGGEKASAGVAGQGEIGRGVRGSSEAGRGGGELQ